MPNLLIPPDLGKLSPSWRRGARNRSCGLGKRADGKEKRPHFVKKGKGSPKSHALSQSAAHPRAISSWKPKDTSRLTLCKYPPLPNKQHMLKIAPVLRRQAAGTAKGQADPGGKLNPAPTGHSPVRVSPFSCPELVVYLARGRDRTLVVNDQEAAGRLGSAPQGTGPWQSPFLHSGLSFSVCTEGTARPRPRAEAAGRRPALPSRTRPCRSTRSGFDPVLYT